VELHFRAHGNSAAEAEALLAEIGPRVEELLGDRIYSRDGSPLEAAVGAMLKARGATLAVAESCTGGMLAQRLTSVAGSSDYFRGGYVVYTRELKHAMLGLAMEELAGPLVYSEATAENLAQAARVRSGSTYALAVVGVAGPGPDAGFDAGHVVLSLSSAEKTEARTLKLFGDRDRVRFMATQSALDWLRKTYLRG
jgi:nicotinamide-nucleotide amidase